MGYRISDFVGCFFFAIKSKYLANILETTERWKKDIRFNTVNNVNLVYVLLNNIRQVLFLLWKKKKKVLISQCPIFKKNLKCLSLCARNFEKFSLSNMRRYPISEIVSKCII